ncbi:dihydroxyacetone kinase subunit DhaL [Gleimia europaea]|uniref:Dihydroxyacetone kinase, L subunit n=1 Tax=Gleimia europaea ACS-120-V-Col10b TaxID=883069 RepID=A0A9W5RCN6_9ACTO|nr:dihydroxyacetone kinase subunit DhaL [Gleimia europaea]EPD29345.1 dihydroxyacetone kinase, L subunit [Gleimia europaea ACS-120-V-Col10b]
MSLDVNWALAWIQKSAAAISQARLELIDLDRQIGDGDHGENMDRGFSAVKKALATADVEDIQSVLKLVAKTLMSTVGGAAGPLYGTAFLRAAKAATGEKDLDANAVANLIEAALLGIQTRGKAQEGEKTMVDAWAPAAKVAREVATSGGDGAQALRAAAQAARAGAEATKPLQATKGRASYLGERSIGHLDPGAVSSAIILEQAVAAIDV